VVESTLARLRELALALPRPNCDWEQQPQFSQPATPESIANFERLAGFALPGEFCEFLAENDSVVAMSIHNGYFVGGLSQLARSVDRGDFPRSVHGNPAIAVAADGGGNAFLLAANGPVWRWDHDTGSVVQSAASFGVFLDRVAADWAAYIADTPEWSYMI